MADKAVSRAPEVVIGHVLLGGATLLYAVAPLCSVVFGGLIAPPSPNGFGQSRELLLRLTLTSVEIGVGAAAIALAIALMASAHALFSLRFGRIYRTWLSIMLFTNPVFLVLGFSSLLATADAFVAVLLAEAYVVLPLGGMVIQSGFDQFSRPQLLAASSLGADRATILGRHVLPSVRGQIGLALFLMSLYGMGFYLLPTFVGFGRVTTLGSSINTAANAVGDWTAALQLSCLLLVVQCVLLLIWWLGFGLRLRAAQ